MSRLDQSMLQRALELLGELMNLKEHLMQHLGSSRWFVAAIAHLDSCFVPRRRDVDILGRIEAGNIVNPRPLPLAVS